MKEYLKEFNIKLGQVKREKTKIEKETKMKERTEQKLPVIRIN